MNFPAQARWRPDLAGRDGPRYRAIAAALHDDILSGRLPPGTRLPTHRDLAWELKVTVGTVTRAYQEAERQGLIGGEVGRGTFVRDPRRPIEAPLEPTPGGNLIDLSVNAPALSADAPALREALQAVAQRPDLADLMGYSPAHGLERLRATFARWIGETTGLGVSADQILPTPGGQGAMHAALSALARPGDAVLVEQLTYPGVKALAAQLGLRLVPVAMDRHGLLPDAVEQAAAQHGAHVLYCMPTLQNPTTITMPLDRRRALVQAARRIGLTIVEDDVYGFLDENAPPPLYQLGPDLTVHVGGLSKSLFAGLRAGYLVPPRPLLDRMSTMLRSSVLSTAHLGVIVAATMIESGEASRIARRRRAFVAERQAMARRVLGFDPPGSDRAATHLWLPLPEPWRREAFAREVMERGIKITPADVFTVARGDTPHAVRICLCSVERTEVIEGAIATIADLLRQPALATTALV